MWGNGKYGFSYQYTFAWKASAGGIDPGAICAGALAGARLCSCSLSSSNSRNESGSEGGVSGAKRPD
ncbi:predicted protein [Pyrenophora tritici-repentis Pt-1C-BFP]|uniref:Uncharacterized protein n=1 Tax=Pyrenophora tritici-repentis (strain Pt-1C-BFP) TaxID=426418 RepID=B2W4I8_PYRTR|nr:uncharacterized protein PTRG_04538 [Pyrenophora tritici-repentis Pt-1C-BFP]EDU47445.1 predicted protein [Pyrenophora tritici-repentis Pt-1C-BFP]